MGKYRSSQGGENSRPHYEPAINAAVVGTAIAALARTIVGPVTVKNWDFPADAGMYAVSGNKLTGQGSGYVENHFTQINNSLGHTYRLDELKIGAELPHGITSLEFTVETDPLARTYTDVRGLRTHILWRRPGGLFTTIHVYPLAAVSGMLSFRRLPGEVVTVVNPDQDGYCMVLRTNDPEVAHYAAGHGAWKAVSECLRPALLLGERLLANQGHEPSPALQMYGDRAIELPPYVDQNAA